MSAITVTRVDRAELSYRPKPWPFAIERRAEIEAHFAALKAHKPAVWNGPVLLLADHSIEGGVLRGAYLRTDFASFTAWKEWHPANAGVVDCTAATAVLSADGALLLGVMGEHTANAGQMYFPCGTPDPNDIVGGRVDLEGSAWRELAEETGIAASEFKPDPGWYLVTAGNLLLALKVLRADVGAEALRARIHEHLRADPDPELSDVRAVFGPADLDPAMTDFVIGFLDYWWRNGGPCRR